MASETEKFRHLTVPYLIGNGCDVASGGDPVVPECISIDLPEEEYAHYNSGQPHRGQINLRAHADALPFKDGSLDWLYSSHLLEDFALEEWPRILGEWIRVLRPGGTLVILIPEKTLWDAAIAAGQSPNCSHKHEGTVGELTGIGFALGLKLIRDEQVGDYSILYIGEKK